MSKNGKKINFRKKDKKFSAKTEKIRMRGVISYCVESPVSVTLKPKTVAMNKSYKKFSLVLCDLMSQVAAHTTAKKIFDKMVGGIEKISTFASSEPAKPLSDAQIGGSFYVRRGAV